MRISFYFLTYINNIDNYPFDNHNFDRTKCKIMTIFHLNIYSLAETPPVSINPCLPSPCGPNAECQVKGESPACSCIENYVGLPPNCRPECTINPECPPQLACLQQKCRDPCVSLCGLNAQCSVVNHHAVCACIAGYTGNPFNACERVPEGEYAPLYLLFLFTILPTNIAICMRA